MQVADLIRYNHVVRGLYFDTLAKLPWAQVVEPRGLSFDSMRDVFLHLTFVEDRWINCIIPGRPGEIVGMDFDVFKDFDSLKNYMQKTARNTENYLSNLTRKTICLILPRRN
ncbi:MAG: DinB family protein [Candidatus Bathyarchaeia archaeon]